jgi:hypothetical protein
MKVVQQLIEHFWDRGSLPLEQAHYLVEHGFIRAVHLAGYVPRPDADDEACNKARVEVLLPTEWDRAEEALIGQPTGKKLARKRRGRRPRGLTAAQRLHEGHRRRACQRA